MPFYAADAPVPEGLQTEKFLLEPLGPQHNPLDYDAVMASQAVLRRRSMGDWPRDGFTPEENLADLEGHAADFQARIGFTYTVLRPDRQRCLGCIYIYPLIDSLQRRVGAEQQIAQTSEADAYVWFWVRPDGVAADVDKRLVDELLPWVRREFAFPRVVVLTWENDPRQIELLQSVGLRELWAFEARQSRAIYFE